jgi:hypothetical protein
MNLGNLFKQFGDDFDPKKFRNGMQNFQSADNADAPIVGVPNYGMIPRQQPNYQMPPQPGYAMSQRSRPLFQQFGGQQMPMLARGGRLRPGQTGIVGEEGPEFVRVNPDGTTEIVPMRDPNRYGDPNAPMPAGLGDGTQAPANPYPENEVGAGSDSNEAPPPIQVAAPAKNRLFGSGDYATLIQQNLDDIEANKKGLTSTGGKAPRKHSLMGRLGSGLWKAYKNWDGQGGLVGLGAAVLEGGIRSASSPQAHQEIRLEDKQNKLFRNQAIARQRETFDAKQAQTTAQTQNIYADNTRQQADLARKAKKDRETKAYWAAKIDQGKLKLANDTELLDLRDKWATSKDSNDKRRLDLVEKEMENRNLRNDANIQSRERVAGTREAGVADRAKTKLAAMDAKGKSDAVNKAVQRWMDQNPGYTQDDVQAVRDNLTRIYQ